MAEATKACNLTQAEIAYLIVMHGSQLGDLRNDRDERIERINYLNKRLKAFQEPEETKTETKPAAAGWGNPNT